MKVNTLMTDGGNTAEDTLYSTSSDITNLQPLSSRVEESWKNGNTFNYLDPTNGGTSNSTTTVGVNNNNSNNSNTSTNPAKTTLSSVSSNSYGDSLYMDERAVDESIEIINELSRKFYEVFSDLLLVEDSLRKKGEASGWWSVSSNFAPDLFYNHKFITLADTNNKDYPANKLLSIYHGDEGVSNFFKQPSFNGLISSLEEIKQAILNYSNGVDTDNALSILRAWIGPSCNLAAKNYSSFGSSGGTGTVSSNVDPVTVAPIEVPISSTGTGNENGSNIMDSVVIDFDKDDGADNIKVKDSATDDITNVSSDELIKDSSSVAIPGVASIIGSSTRNGSLAGAVGVGAGILGLNGDAPLEMLDTNVDEIDGSDMAGSVSDAISDFITPDVGIAKGRVVKSSAGASAIAATFAGVGALSAGGIGGKIYMDKKKNEDDGDDDMVSYDDDDFFDREEENEEEPTDTSIVDFKNEILNDNL